MGPGGLAPAVDFSSSALAGSGSSAGSGTGFGNIVGAGYFGSLFDAVSPFILSWINNRYATQQQRRNNRYLEQMQRDQNAFNVSMLNRQNSYNSPREMIARLRAAGLNPNLAYGSLSAGASPGLQAVASPGFDAGTAPRVPTNTQTALIYHNLKMQQYERSLAKEELESKKLQNVGQELSNENQKFVNKYQEDDKKREIDTWKQTYANLQETQKQIIATTNQLNAMTDLQFEKIAQEKLNTKYLEKTLDDRVNLIKAQYNLTVEETEQVKQATRLLILQQATEIAKRKNLDKQTAILEQQLAEAKEKWSALKSKAQAMGNNDILISEELLKYYSAQGMQYDNIHKKFVMRANYEMPDQAGFMQSLSSGLTFANDKILPLYDAFGDLLKGAMMMLL